LLSHLPGLGPVVDFGKNVAMDIDHGPSKLDDPRLDLTKFPPERPTRGSWGSGPVSPLSFTKSSRCPAFSPAGRGIWCAAPPQSRKQTVPPRAFCPMDFGPGGTKGTRLKRNCLSRPSGRTVARDKRHCGISRKVGCKRCEVRHDR